MTKKKLWVKNHFVSPKDRIRTVMKTISSVSTGIAIAVDENEKMVGFVMDGDIRRALLKGINLSSPISKIMNTNPYVLPYGIGPEEQLKLLKEAKRHRAPVIDKDGHIRDIVLYWDLLKKRKQSDFFIHSKDKKTGRHSKEVLIVGGAGYIGSIMSRILLDKGYKVRVLDKLIFGDAAIKDLYSNPSFKLIEGDVLNTDTVVNAVFGVDAVVNLAALVGDPACDLDHNRTIMVNYISSKMLADISKHMGIQRYVFASTCSVYGASKGSNKLTESSPTNTVSLYAETKLKSEWGILELADDDFAPCVLRLATVFGFSPRPRFDLMINIFTAMAIEKGEITVFGGDQFRPNVHVYDAAHAFIKVIEAPIKKIYKQIFNAGSTDLNFKIQEIAEKVVEVIPGTKLKVLDKEVDKRDYNVSFEKIRKAIGFKCTRSIEDGIQEIQEAFKQGKIKDYTDDVHSNFKSQFTQVFIEEASTAG